MPFRLKIAIFISIWFHLLLIALFVFFSIATFRKIVTLGSAGGVVWLNLNPGGSGSGGMGGMGAPEKNLPSELKTVSSAEAGAQAAIPPKVKAEVKTAREKPVKKIASPKIVENQMPEKAEAKDQSLPKQAFPGPGVGDTEGKATGPGGGEKQGKGAGEDEGEGTGKGPGGVGPPGTGGSGSGGEGNRILSQIRAKILRAKRYPAQARQDGIEGVCGIVFRINEDGSLAALSLSQSSGHEILDQEALATVRRAAPFPYYASPIQFKLRFNLEDR